MLKTIKSVSRLIIFLLFLLGAYHLIIPFVKVGYLNINRYFLWALHHSCISFTILGLLFLTRTLINKVSEKLHGFGGLKPYVYVINAVSVYYIPKAIIEFSCMFKPVRVFINSNEVVNILLFTLSILVAIALFIIKRKSKKWVNG